MLNVLVWLMHAFLRRKKGWHEGSLFSFRFFGRQQSTSTLFSATPARVLGFQFWGIALIDDEPIVVVEFITRFDLFDRFDKNMISNFIRFAIGIAGMIDPLGAVALHAAVDDVTIRDVKIKSMVGL